MIGGRSIHTLGYPPSEVAPIPSESRELLFLTILTYIGISPSGKAPDSESGILGSNPSIPAISTHKIHQLCLMDF